MRCLSARPSNQILCFGYRLSLSVYSDGGLMPPQHTKRTRCHRNAWGREKEKLDKTDSMSISPHHAARNLSVLSGWHQQRMYSCCRFHWRSSCPKKERSRKPRAWTYTARAPIIAAPPNRREKTKKQQGPVVSCLSQAKRSSWVLLDRSCCWLTEGRLGLSPSRPCSPPCLLLDLSYSLP